MPTDMAMDNRVAMGERERLRKRLALNPAPAMGGAGNVPDEAMPQPAQIAAAATPPPPEPLMRHGGGVNLATGSTPALNNQIGGRSEAQVAQEARVNATNLRGAYRAAILPEQKAQILADIHRHESIASAYEQGQNGYQVRAQRPDEVSRNRENLSAQAETFKLQQRQAAEAAGQPAPQQSGPVEFAPYDYGAAKQGVERDQERWNGVQKTGREAIDIIREREAVANKLATTPAQAKLASTDASVAGSEAAASESRAKIAESDQKAKLLKVQTEGMTGGGASNDIGGLAGQQMRTKLLEAKNAADAAARDLSLKSTAKSWDTANHAVSLLEKSDLPKSVADSGSLGSSGADAAEGMSSILDRVEQAWPTLDDAQKQNISQRLDIVFPPGSKLDQSSAGEDFVNLSRMSTPLGIASGLYDMSQGKPFNKSAALLSQKKILQQRINRIRSGAVGTP